MILTFERYYVAIIEVISDKLHLQGYNYRFRSTVGFKCFRLSHTFPSLDNEIERSPSSPSIDSIH